MKFRQIFSFLNVSNMLYLFVNVIWIFVIEFMFYRILTDYTQSQKECQKQSAKSELPRQTGNRREKKLHHDSQKTNHAFFVILKILPFIILCVILVIDPNSCISNTNVITSTGLLATSFVWCTLRYFHILHADPDKRRWRLRHTNQLGPGLAHNYWDGFLQNLY